MGVFNSVWFKRRLQSRPRESSLPADRILVNVENKGDVVLSERAKAMPLVGNCEKYPLPFTRRAGLLAHFDKDVGSLTQSHPACERSADRGVFGLSCGSFPRVHANQHP
jgi:hypothetical protein